MVLFHPLKDCQNRFFAELANECLLFCAFFYRPQYSVRSFVGKSKFALGRVVLPERGGGGLADYFLRNPEVRGKDARFGLVNAAYGEQVGPAVPVFREIAQQEFAPVPGPNDQPVPLPRN